MLREDVDCGGVVSTVRQVQGAELGHQVHETASHALLVLREPTDANTPATTLSLSICTLQLWHSQISAQEPPPAHGDIPRPPHNCSTEQNTHACHLGRRKKEVLRWVWVSVVQTVSIITCYQPGTRCDPACPVPPAELQLGCCSPLRLMRMCWKELGATRGWSHCLDCP